MSTDLRHWMSLFETPVQSVPQVLYHGTGAKEWQQIQQTDVLQRAEWRLQAGEPYGISLTDSERVARVFATDRADGRAGVILVLDGAKLAARYELEPYQDPRLIRSEHEWRLFGEIEPLSAYVVQVIHVGEHTMEAVRRA